MTLDLATAAVATGAASAAAMYLNAKYHIQKDMKIFINLKHARSQYEKAVRERRESLYYFFETSARRRGNDECIWSRSGTYTWNEALDMVHRYAQWFLAQGVKPKDLVAFYLQNSPDFVFAWIGLWAVGAAPAMINYNLAGPALTHCLKISGAKLLLVDDKPELRARINEVSEVIEKDLGIQTVLMDEKRRGDIYSQAPIRPDDSVRAVVEGDWPMALINTSGTTGMPKAVPFMIHRLYPGGVPNLIGEKFITERDRWYDCMPMYHGTGGVTAVSMMMNGVALCIGEKFSTSKFWSDIRDSRATWFVYVGETARYLLAAPPSPLDKTHCLRGMYGNGLRPDVWIRFRDRFGIQEVGEFFDSSEGMLSLFNHCKGDFFATSVGHQGLLLRTLFKNMHATVEIDQATGDIARDPETGFAIRRPMEVGGEVIVQVPSEQAFAGYWRNPSATAKKFERDVFSKGDIWYRSGDALRRDRDGRWYFLDRLGDTFRWKGENVSTAEVAEVLGKFDGIVEANVYGVQLPNHDGRAGCAAIYIDPKNRDGFDFAGFLKYSRKLLPRYAVPVFLRVVREMTPIHNNKQNKVPLRNEGVDLAKVKAGDVVLWVPPGGTTYEPFTPEKWEAIQGGRASL